MAIITIDQYTTRYLKEILNAKSGNLPKRQKFRIGWGAYNADLFTYQSVTMLRLPDLSRCAVFGREASQSHVERIIAAAAALVVGRYLTLVSLTVHSCGRMNTAHFLAEPQKYLANGCAQFCVGAE